MTNELLPRLLGICMALNSSQVSTAADLARRFNVTSRTVYRNVEFLQQLGLPIISVPGPGGGYRIGEGSSVPSVLLGHTSLVSYLAARVLTGSESEASRLTDHVLERAKNILPEEDWQRLQEIQRCVLIDSEHWYWRPAEEPSLEIIREALLAGDKLNVTYRRRANDAEVSDVVHPYGIVWKAGAWYLVGFAEADGRVARIKVERVVRANRISDKFRRPADFDLKKYWSESLESYGTGDILVRLRISSTAAVQFENFGWKSTSVITRTDNGLMADIFVDRYEWLIPVVLGYAGEVEVLAPADLVDSVNTAARRLLAKHSTSMTGASIPEEE